MRSSRPIMAAFGAATLAFMAPAAANAAIALCGAVDQGVGDSDPTVGILAFSCNVGTGVFTGSAFEFQQQDFELITIKGTATGTGTLGPGTAAYNVGPWVGNGGLRTFVKGTFVGQAVGGEGISVTATASTFNGGASTATAPIGGPGGFQAETIVPGAYAGPGILTWSITWNAGNGTIDLRHTADFLASVPEPGTWALMTGGFGVVGATLRRRRAAFA